MNIEQKKIEKNLKKNLRCLKEEWISYVKDSNLINAQEHIIFSTNNERN